MQMRLLRRPQAAHFIHTLIASLTLTCMSNMVLATPTQQDAKGLWLSADKDAVIEFKNCLDAPSALCGTIVWDKDAGTPDDTCGVMIAKLKRYDDDAWRDGWVFDPRSNKHYKGAIRVNKDSKPETLQVRAFVGVEILGETEEMTRVSAIPAGCKAH